MLVPCPLPHLEISPGDQDGERSSTNATKIIPVPGDFMVSGTNTRVSEEEELMVINIDSSEQSRA